MIGGLAGVVLAVVPGFTTLPLHVAEARVVANSAAVATAAAMVRQRESDLRVAKTGGVPHLTGDYSLAPQAAPTGTSTVEQHFLAVGAGISVNDLLGAPATTRVAAAELLAAQRNADAVALQARSDGVKLYFAALQAVAIERVRQQAVAAAQRDLGAARLRARVGEAPRLDVLRAGVTLAQSQADAARAAAERANAIAALASAARVNPSDLVPALATRDATPSPPVSLDEKTAVARALAMRPELSALLASVEAREANVTVARESGWPTLTAAAGYQGGVDTAIPVHGAQAAVHVDVPLAPLGGDRVAGARAQVDAAQAELFDARRTIALGVAAAVRTAHAALVAQTAADRARDQAQKSLVAVELGYREGASSSLDIADARRTYEQAAVDALVAQYDRAQDLALLEVLVP